MYKITKKLKHAKQGFIDLCSYVCRRTVLEEESGCESEDTHLSETPLEKQEKEGKKRMCAFNSKSRTFTLDRDTSPARVTFGFSVLSRFARVEQCGESLPGLQ